ncbi:flagellar hook-associated protein 3 [Pusillimonas sp. TS35]|uniref:flagellar hook-associated protein FlgL n=1 Tax=Paracandidimonas lactea TaxID=2895524 RepID=UPI00136A45C8|nr:flagellar hook-associated protein FlgL [Paracandidimonas lactea]MYN11644.1 flagellar hook-associated protein 3 [Pusillimonas sp. TS35]
MRISSTQFYQTGLFAINSQQSEVVHLYKQLGSGKRMVTPADDPLAAAQAINLSQSKSLSQRYADNRSVAKQNLGVEENTLSSVTTLLQDIKTRLVEAGNGTMSNEDRATLANVLRNARTSLLGLANATDGNGQYLFSGSRGEVEPFQETGAGVVYNGDALQRNIQADQTRLIPGSDTGTDVFNRAAPGTSSYLTRAGAANGGTGVVGKPLIENPAGTGIGSTFSLTFTAAQTFDVIVTAPDGTTQTYNGIAYDAASGRVSLPGGIQISVTGAPQAGDTFVAEPAAGAGADLNIFDTLEGMIAALQLNVQDNAVETAQFQNALGATIQRVDVSYNNVLTVRASVGARLNELDALDANGSQRTLGYTAQLSGLEDLDYYAASTNLQLRLSALEAASLAFQKIQATSLFNIKSS